MRGIWKSKPLDRARSLFLVVLVCLIVPMVAQGQTAVSGVLKDPGGTPITSLNSYVRFTLVGFGSNIPRVTGTNVVVPPYRDFHPDGSGNISGTIQGNDTITIGGNSQPGGTWYQVCLFDKGIQFRCETFTITGSSWNLNSATPNTTSPTVPAPTGDSTYLRLDGGNQPTGNLIPAANGTQSLGNSSAKWNAVLNNLTISGTCTGCSVGSVTSVGLTVPSWLSVAGSPITTNGTFAVSPASGQTSHQVIGTCGTATSFAPCSLMPADYPVFVASGASHAPGAVPDPGSSAGTTRFLREDATWAAPPGGNSTVFNTTASATAATIGSTTMVTAPASDTNYEFNAMLAQTGATSGCSTQPSFQIEIVFTDAFTGGSRTALPLVNQLGNSGTFNNAQSFAAALSAATTYSTHLQLRAKASTTVNYTVVYSAGVGCGTGANYSIAPVLVQE